MSTIYPNPSSMWLQVSIFYIFFVICVMLVTLDDPDLVTPEVIDSILERELGRNHSSMATKSKRG